MKKNNNKEKNKSKKVHFNEDQLTERAKTMRPKSADKKEKKMVYQILQIIVIIFHLGYQLLPHKKRPQ
jgi:hypothetical protein